MKMDKNCLLDLERNYWMELYNESQANPKNWKRSVIKLDLDKRRAEMMEICIKQSIFQPGGLIIPRLKEDPEGDLTNPRGTKMALHLGEQIQISDDKVIIRYPDKKTIELPFLKPELEIQQGSMTRQYDQRIAQHISKTGVHPAIFSIITQLVHETIEKYLRKLVIALIKELLFELIPGDEVELEKAIEIVTQEAALKYPGHAIPMFPTFLENFLKFVGENVSGFKFIRLKQSIRCTSDVSKELDSIDVLFEEWNQKSLKKQK
ncbi:hypothetical protein [Candidatus Lokiarchaeum ossiferum]|uniref:hypothetical protein n=1 Tax=Candidatus Lokiarchaeum ossiferum TaxID=2951803 RepID=UPI00352E20D3